ncbi:MAG: hypothetical protein RDU20_03190 [Desulfomonilaceae bacterium]|nr:hypothetical protein [Desulfomonilaceae bacterium]
MEKFKPPDYRRDEKRSTDTAWYDEVLRPLEAERETDRGRKAEELVRRFLNERSQRAARRKWTGRVLIVFGFLTVLGSCPVYAVSLIPGQTIMAGVAVMLAGLAMITGGGILASWRTRLKDTNEAMVIALKHENRLTTSRLALEMDISFEKADKIIQELVRNGIAEIDLEHRDSEHTLVYKIKGL